MVLLLIIEQYNQIKRKMGKSGSGNYLSSFPYASEMSELLDSKPISIEKGIAVYLKTQVMRKKM